ncbi:MAG: O-antigen ligase family protein [Dehalococcoidia bacterium]|nr:O-antigen ligase family protein [Dehalococcoidia bacterium]MDP7085235.1 O-antigen ligase family protein [Dehalococcoidia bacterium]
MGGGAVGGSLGARLEYMDVGFEALRDRPILGWGHGNFGTAFDRFADASIYVYGPLRTDQAHSQPIEELATHGVLGTLAFAALWLALLWAVVRRRRPPREEIVAYAVLGALAGHFVQNLFLFYTPASLLFWVILVAWVAGQESGVERAAERENAGPQGSGTIRRAPQSLQRKESPKWAPLVLGVVLVSVLALSMYHLVYVPYSANRTMTQAFNDPNPLASRLALATKSFEAAPGMSYRPRELMFSLLLGVIDEFSPEEKKLVADFVLYEVQRTLDGDSKNVRVVANGIAMLQPMASPEGLEFLDRLLRHLREQAPEREYTYALLANQENLKGNHREAIRIAEEFEALTPWVSETLVEIKRVAVEALGDG